MGGFGTGFLSAVSNAVQKKSDQAAADAQQKKHDEAAVHMAALQSGTLTPDQQEQAWANWQKLYGHSKGLKEALPKLITYAKHAINHGKTQDQSGQPQAATPPADGSSPITQPQPASAYLPAGAIPPPPGGTATPPAVPPPPATAAPAMAASSPTSALASPPPQAESDGKPAAGDGVGTSTGTQNVSRGTIPPPPSPRVQALDTTDPGAVAGAQMADNMPPVAKPASAATVGAPAPVGVQPWELGAAFPNPDALAKKKQDIEWEQEKRKMELAHQYKLEENKALAEARANNPTGRPVGGPQLSVQNARTLLEQGGGEFNDQDGNAIDVNSLPDNMGLKAFFQGNRRYYVPFSPNDRVVNLGGISYAIDPMNVAGVTTGQGTALGAQRAGTSTSSMAPLTVMGPDGRVQQLPGSRTQTPATPGAFGAPPQVGGVPRPPVAPGSPAAPVPTGVAPPASAGKSTGKTAPAAASPNTSTNSVEHGSAKPAHAPIVAAGRTLPAGTIPMGQYAQQQKRNTAINGAGLALKRFSQPQEEGGFSNLDVFKDKDAVNRIAQYLKLNNEQIEGQFDSAEKGGTEGVFSFYAGLPQAYASASTGAVKKAYDGLTEHDKRFVTDYYALLGQWGGMRAASGASGSLWNFRNLSQEIPNPMSITSYPEAVRKVKDNVAELNQTAKPNTTATSYSENDILPPSKKTATKAVPAPPGADAAKKFSVTAPDGSVHTFKNQAGVDKFNKLLADAQKGAK